MAPESVHIGEEVDTERISGHNVTLYPGTRIFGEKTLVMEGAGLGAEGPVTVDNCIIGPDVSLKGGFFKEAVFAGKNTFGTGAHVREGTILEEEASAAHCVGLKQTILFPFVTLGSLINFCDCLMAGGTDRKNHSEVGSAYIHFNYTPFQDKATPSMLGNVHQGVMLDQPPVFLGGQGGLVGPCRIAFGCVTAAGSIIRKDEENPDRLLFGGAVKETSVKRSGLMKRNVPRIYNHNCRYIAALISLMNWYRHVRALFVQTRFEKERHTGMVQTLYSAIEERMKRLDAFTNLLDPSGDPDRRAIDGFRDAKPVLTEFLETDYSDTLPANFLASLSEAVKEKGGYIDTIKGLDPEVRAAASQWLHHIENGIMEKTGI